MQNYLVISALIDNSREIIRDLTKLAKSSGCNITDVILQIKPFTWYYKITGLFYLDSVWH